MRHHPSRTSTSRALRGVLAALLVAGTGAAALAGAPLAQAAGPVPIGVTVTGGTGTVTNPVTGAVFAGRTMPVILTATTDPTAVCVEVSTAGGTRVAAAQAVGGQRTWTLTLTAGLGDGVQLLTVQAGTALAPGTGACTEAAGAVNTPGTGSYVLDNTGPVVSITPSITATAQGWFGAPVTFTFTGVDAGVGVAPAVVTSTVSSSTSTAGTSVTALVRDLLGNRTSAGTVARVDLIPPVITGTRQPAAGPAGWNTGPVTVTFACTDVPSGIATCPAPVVVSQDGANQTVTRSAVDNAALTGSVSVGPINLDGTPPTLSGVATTPPNPAGWYRDDVTIRWTASDATSGLAGPVPDSVIGGEGTDLTAVASAADVAGNRTGPVGSAAVRIDRTPPTTSVQLPVDWVRTDQTLRFATADNLSGVAGTTAVVDGGAPQQGDSVTISGDGVHSIEYWSADAAGNQEGHRTAQVRIDGTAPSIRHTLSTEPNQAGWHRSPVTVTFLCADGLSGVESCSDPVLVDTEAAGRVVAGRAADVAGNQALDPVTVNLDRTAPVISAAVDREPNGSGWYRAPVRVDFSCTDALAGIAPDGCLAPVTLAEGAGRSARGSATDLAGNTSSTTVSGLDIDTSAPTLAGAPRIAPGPQGWYADDVTVDWDCSDPLSGIDGACPPSTLLTGEGAALSSSATVADRAGNPTTRTVDGLRIDRTAPVTQASLPATASGWYSAEVLVTIEASDALSGVARTRYRLDGAEPQTYTAPVLVGGTARHQLVYWSEDVAGNVESTEIGHLVEIPIDVRLPTIRGVVSPAANANGWHREPVTVRFDCTDQDSGLAACDPGTTLAEAGADQSVPGAAADLAGNTASTTVEGINIDLTPPTLVGEPTTAPDAAGWYRGDVTLDWVAQDGLSGPDPASRPDPTVLTGEGADLVAGPVSVADLAGNRTTATRSGINIDRTAPLITGAATEPAGASGWYRGDVTVRFACTDALSGVATCPSEKVVAGNGADRSVTSDPARDLAGNQASGVTVGGFAIDGLPPSTASDNNCPVGACSAGTAQVRLTATDQPGLSGVTELHYTINGGAEQVRAGATAELTVPLTAGVARLTYYAVDLAGNVEPVTSVTLDGDQIAPSVTHVSSPAPNAEGWNNTDVTVTFTARDDDSGSGVDPASVTAPVLVDQETPAAGRIVVGSATDLAGNRGTDTVLVRLDQTAPTVGVALSPAAGPAGWWTTPVTVRFDCQDALSGVAVCPDDVTLTSNGAGQGVQRSATDVAGNSRSASVTDVRIDREPPVLTRVSVRDGGLYQLGAVPPPTCSGTDRVSGFASCVVGLEGPAGAGVGSYRYTAVGTDVAGNTTTVRGSFRVVYRFDGFSPPIHDLRWFGAGAGFAVFRAGSTVPVRVQLKTAAGTPVQGGSPTFVTPVRACLAVLDVNSPLGAGGSASVPFTWNPASRTWEYLWDTRGLRSGHLYRIGATLDDGRTYYAYIGLA